MASQSIAFPVPEISPCQDRITIIGGGIVGSALAVYLSTNNPDSQIFLLDSSPPSTAGSTAIAPGLVGQFNTIPYLTAMAKESVTAYSKAPGGFQNVGGLEIASTAEGIANLRARHELAKAAGLEAELLTSTQVAEIAPDFHAEDETSVGLLFPGDGTADPPLIVKYYQEQATANGVCIMAENVSGISVGEDGKFSLDTSQGHLKTNKLIVAAGIWTPNLANSLGIDLPIVPVAHPYAYGPTRPRREKQQPFLRWPERHVYALDHGECDGLGSYSHKPIAVAPGQSALSQLGPDPAVLDSALIVFSPHQRQSKTPYKAFNGIFALTPDSMPLAGAISQIPGLYVAAAVWITHAAGVARLVADIVAGKELNSEDEALKKAFDPTRLVTEDLSVLKEKALGTYNDIYNKEQH